jgi:Holliday junction resolvase
MSGGPASRQKGNWMERAIVRALQEHGFAAERVPLSGAPRRRFGGDISVPGLDRDVRGEAKCRSNRFKRLYEWLRAGKGIAQ